MSDATARYNPWRAYAAAGAICAAMTAGAYFAGVAPALERAAAVEASRAELASQRKAASDALAAAAGARAEFARARAALAALPLRFEPASSVNHRLAKLTDLANATRLSVEMVRPGATVAGADFDSVPIELAGTGSYPACAAFLRRLHDEFPDTAVRALEASNKGTSTTFRFELVWYTARRS